MSTDPPSRLVIVDYQEIASSKDLSVQLDRAFGGHLSSSDSSPLGIIAVRNVPNFVSAKQNFLPLAHALAHLDAQYLEQELSDPESMYNAGWSHGKEKLGDEPDFAKASYYFNPLTDKPGTDAEREKYPASYPCNKWPNEEEVPQLKQVSFHVFIAILLEFVDGFSRLIYYVCIYSSKRLLKHWAR